MEFRRKIIHIPNFVDSSDSNLLYSNEKYIAYAGRLSEEKGIETLIKAFMRTRNRKIRLLVIGEGPKKNELRRISQNDSRIEFVGYLNGKKLNDVRRNALAIAVPSEWYENAPLTILEAFALGKPVIGSRIGGITEMIDEGVNGFLFEAGNISALTDAIDNLFMLREGKVKELGKAAREKVKIEYSPERHYQKLIKTYQRRHEILDNMRIAYIAIKGMPIGGGIEKMTEEIGRRLVRKGHQVRVYCSRDYGTKDGNYNGMYIRTVHSANTRSLQKMSTCVFAMWDFLKNNDIDIVHIHAVGPSVLSFIPRIKGVPTVVQTHGLEWKRDKWGSIGKTFFKLADYTAVYFPNKTTSVSKVQKRYYENKFGREIIYIPPGISETKKHQTKLDVVKGNKAR